MKTWFQWFILERTMPFSSFAEGSFIFAGFDFDLRKCINSKAHEDPLSVGIEPALD